MPRDEKEKTKPGDGKPSLSRREFALASLAVLGAQPLSTAEDPPPLSDEARAMKLVLDEGVRERLEERHITEEDMRRVLCHAEQSGEKLCRPQGGDSWPSSAWPRPTFTSNTSPGMVLSASGRPTRTDCCSKETPDD